ncbi:MAG TPA: hypothetical protein VFU09_00760 [Candidatus Udaeobacter sp.]|nr:hypothetical protein [Candidatus Udaeobacter sp.]
MITLVRLETSSVREAERFAPAPARAETREHLFSGFQNFIKEGKYLC